MKRGIKGEGHVDHTIWVCKTQHPFSSGFYLKQEGQAVVLLVRNIWKVMISVFLMISTKSHYKKIVNEVPKEFPEQWNEYVLRSIKTITAFYRYWMHHAKEMKTPVYILRFEDIITSKSSAMTDCFEFILG